MENLFDFNPGTDYSSAFNLDLGLPSYGVSSAYNNLGTNPNTSGGMFSGLGNFLNSNFMSNVGGPLLSAGLSGLFTNQAARNYGQSAYQATAIGALAGKEAALMNFGLGERSQDLAQQRRYDDAAYRLNQMKGKPYQDLNNKQFRAQIASRDAPASGMLAGRFHTMFG